MLPSRKTLSFLLPIINYLIRRVNVIFEFGSRYGEDTIEFAKAFPNAKIFGFECNPNTIGTLHNNVKPYRNITITESAVGDQIGKVKFYPINAQKTITTWNDGNQGASSLYLASDKYTVETYVQYEVDVSMVTLKYVMELYNLDAIDVLWMDIQGAELLALRGLGERIKDVKIIHTEVEFIPIYKDQPLFTDVHSYLTSSGFIFFEFSHKGTSSADAIFINATLFKSKFSYGMFVFFMKGIQKIQITSLSMKKILKRILIRLT